MITLVNYHQMIKAMRAKIHAATSAQDRMTVGESQRRANNQKMMIAKRLA